MRDFKRLDKSKEKVNIQEHKQELAYNIVASTTNISIEDLVKLRTKMIWKEDNIGIAIEALNLLDACDIALNHNKIDKNYIYCIHLMLVGRLYLNEGWNNEKDIQLLLDNYDAPHRHVIENAEVLFEKIRELELFEDMNDILALVVTNQYLTNNGLAPLDWASMVGDIYEAEVKILKELNHENNTK